MKFTKIIASRIKEVRERRKLTQEYISTQLGYSRRNSYADIENGVTDINLEKHLLPICQLLKVDMVEILNINKSVEEILIEGFLKNKNTPPIIHK